LSVLTSIGGYLKIESNNSLTILTGLENLITIGDYLKIGGYNQGNPFLTSLTGLESITTIGGFLEIRSNNALTSLTGIDNIAAGSITNLTILSNSSLSTCEVQSICDYLAAPNGTVYIGNNATGCNSQEEVEAACVYLSDGSTYYLKGCAIYPNPTSTIITIELPNISKPQKNTFLTLHNLNGQALLSRQITEPIINVDVFGLVSGVYFVRVVNDRTVMVGKVVKQ